MTSDRAPHGAGPGAGPGEPVDLDLDAWAAWTPTELAARLAAVDVPWWVCGGWAIDLFHGAPRRAHEDIEFAVCRADFPAVRDALLAGGTHHMYYVGDGRAYRLGSVPPPEYTQVWTAERASGLFRTDTFLDPGDRDEWVCKRDERLRRPLADTIAVSADGVPYQRPEVVLLMKAKHRRPKDEADLAATLPLLSAAARAWLADALALIHPGHDWIAAAAGRTP
ncbi:nucleotidyltransferase domain-containing protein [Actinocatenispora rupis]|uniref:Aminoglycoside-2''-adenylyltransferase n=1 Tax=Actinocatenispora rupis TaxID=519421 RepID=A0A8J3NF21_9ACTN|nr:hypothetical protein [Actinocatenispora rupis]GID14450.1 hypothetical protein Aru02nite_53390 [Actinocatenispora rupis]